MNVEMGHCLSPLSTAVNGDPVASLSDALFNRQHVADSQHVSQERSLVIGHVRHRCDVLQRQHQQVLRRLRADIPNSEDLVVFVKNFAWNLPGRDLAEDTVLVHYLAHTSGTSGRVIIAFSTKTAPSLVTFVESRKSRLLINTLGKIPLNLPLGKGEALISPFRKGDTGGFQPHFQQSAL